jgi:glutamyl-tRNA reductase
VFLYNIDDLQTSVQENLARRASEVVRAEAIVDEELEKFGTWLRSRGVIPTVVALRQSFEATRRAELDRLDFKLSALPAEVRDEARTRVDEITHLIVEKLLLTPTEQLKSVGDPETATLYAEAISRVFNLGDSSTEKESGLGARGSESESRSENRVEPFSRAKSRPGEGRQGRSR